MLPTSSPSGSSGLAPAPSDFIPHATAGVRRAHRIGLRFGASWRVLVPLLMLPLAPTAGFGQTTGDPWQVLTFSDGGRERAEVVLVDHASPDGDWLESRAWILDPNGRRLAIGFTATIDGGSITSTVRIGDVVSRREFEVERELRGLTSDGGAFDEVTDLLDRHTLTRLRVVLRIDGDEQDFTAPIQVLNDANGNEDYRPVYALLNDSALRRVSLSEPLRGSLIFLQDTVCQQLPTTLTVFCDEIVPALLRGRSTGTSTWSLAETASLAPDNPKIQRVLRSFPRRDRRTQFTVRAR